MYSTWEGARAAYIELPGCHLRRFIRGVVVYHAPFSNSRPIPFVFAPQIMQYLSAFIAASALLVITPVVAFISVQWTSTSKVPNDVPWVDLRGKWFLPKLRATIRSVVVGKKAIEEGYEKACVLSDPVALPTLTMSSTPSMASPLSYPVCIGRTWFSHLQTLTGSSASPNTP